MRTILPVLLAAATVLSASASPARADDAAINGVYEVKYDEVSNNCTQVGMSMARGTLKVDLRKGNLAVDIERIPVMTGAPAKAGKIKAQSKLGPSTIEGLDGKFSVAGRVDDGVIQLVFVAEYYVKGKPFCTQSWNVSGLKKTELDKK